MRVNGHEIPRRLVLALSGSNGDGVLRSDDAVPMKAAFLEAFGIDLNLSAGALYGWKFICGQDSASWVECPDEILKPTDLLETSERAPQTLTSVAIEDVSRDQPIVVDFSDDPATVRALVSEEAGVAWRTLSPSVDEFLDSLGQ